MGTSMVDRQGSLMDPVSQSIRTGPSCPASGYTAHVSRTDVWLRPSVSLLLQDSDGSHLPHPPTAPQAVLREILYCLFKALP